MTMGYHLIQILGLESSNDVKYIASRLIYSEELSKLGIENVERLI